MKRIPSPVRDPNLRETLALNDEEQCALLRQMDGQQIAPTTATKPKKAPRRKQPPKDFIHPECQPDAEEMIADLTSADAQRYGDVFGGNRVRFWYPADVAARIECELYNNWVLLQCLKRGLREPGELSVDAFIDRFWISTGTDASDDEKGDA